MSSDLSNKYYNLQHRARAMASAVSFKNQNSIYYLFHLDLKVCVYLGFGADPLYLHAVVTLIFSMTGCSWARNINGTFVGNNNWFVSEY